MRLNTTDFWRKCQHPLLIAAGTIPLSVLLAANTLPEIFPMLPLFAVAYVLLAWACLLAPGRQRVFVAVLGVAALALLAAWALPISRAPGLALLPVGYGALLFALLPVGGWPREAELPVAWHVAGLLAHILLQLVANYTRRMASTLYEPVGGLLLVSFLVFAALAMLALNRGSLNNAAQSRVKVPVQMRRQNIVLTLGLLLLSTGLAAMPAIGMLLRRLWDWLMSGIAVIARFFVSLLSHTGERSGGAGGDALSMALGPEEVVEPGLFQQILEKILYLVALVGVVLLLVYLGRKLFQWLRRLLGWMWRRLSLFAGAATKDYEDEITDTRNSAQYEPTGLLKRFRERLSKPDEGRMTPAQRVRYRYLRLRMKHTDWDEASTARETLPTDAAQLYERARYGAQTLTEAEAEQFLEDTRRI